MLSLKRYLEEDETKISNLLVQYYKVLGFTDQEFLFYLQLLSYQQTGNKFPDLDEVAKRMNLQQEAVFALLGQLLDKQWIQIITEKTGAGKMTDVYDLTPVYNKIEQYLKEEQAQQNLQDSAEKEKTLYRSFEEEFKRPLSPIEMETLAGWIQQDQYAPELIRLALKEAVLNQAYSLKYMDRILLSWERKNISTPQQVEREQKKRKNAQADKPSSSRQAEGAATHYPKVPLYNWLNPSENQTNSREE